MGLSHSVSELNYLHLLNYLYNQEMLLQSFFWPPKNTAKKMSHLNFTDLLKIYKSFYFCSTQINLSRLYPKDFAISKYFSFIFSGIVVVRDNIHKYFKLDPTTNAYE